MWATLMQLWARRYMEAVNSPYGAGLPERARIRAFFAHGVDKYGLTIAVATLPGLLHLSVLLFCIGLVDFLLNINHTVAFAVLAWITFGCVMYFIISIMPLFCPDSPYQTPLSPVCWLVAEATPLLMLWVRRRNETVQTAIRDRRTKIRQGMNRTLELEATRLDVRADKVTNALRLTLMSLDEDQKLEEFLCGLPGLFHGSSSGRTCHASEC